MAVVGLVAVFLAALWWLEYEHREERRLWRKEMSERDCANQEERQKLLDRIQAGTLLEYQHLTGATRPPQARSPWRKSYEVTDVTGGDES